MFINRIIGFIMPIPFFVVINGGGLSLPQDFYKVDGIALPCCVLVLFLFKDYFKYNKYMLMLFLIFLVYFLYGVFEENQRHLISIQLIYFLVVTRIFLNLGQNNIQQIISGFNVGLILFISLHLISILFFSEKNLFTNTTQFFGFTVYQSHLTYPLVLCFGCALVLRQKNFSVYLKAYILILCGIIITLTLRRTSLMIYLFILIIYLPFYIKMLGISISTFIFFKNTQSFDLSKFERLFNFFDGNLPRVATWNNSLDLLNHPEIIVYGNGQNNYSHNFYLSLTTSHGMFLGSILILATITYIYVVLKKQNDFYKSACFVSSYILVDFFLNVNITQFYFSTIFALFLCYQPILPRLNNEK